MKWKNRSRFTICILFCGICVTFPMKINKYLMWIAGSKGNRIDNKIMNGPFHKEPVAIPFKY